MKRTAVKKIVQEAIDEAVKIAIVEERSRAAGLEAGRDYWKGSYQTLLTSFNRRERTVRVLGIFAGIGAAGCAVLTILLLLA